MQPNVNLVDEWIKVFKSAGHDMLENQNGYHCEVCGSSLIYYYKAQVEVCVIKLHENQIEIPLCPKQVITSLGDWMITSKSPKEYDPVKTDSLSRFSLIEVE